MTGKGLFDLFQEHGGIKYIKQKHRKGPHSGWVNIITCEDGFKRTLHKKEEADLLAYMKEIKHDRKKKRELD